MGLKEIINAKIKEEIDKDPTGVGYAGKSDKEIMDLLNNPVIKTRVVEDIQTARINVILAGIADTPNIIEEKDITEAKKIGV